MTEVQNMSQGADDVISLASDQSLLQTWHTEKNFNEMTLAVEKYALSGSIDVEILNVATNETVCHYCFKNEDFNGKEFKVPFSGKANTSYILWLTGIQMEQEDDLRFYTSPRYEKYGSLQQDGTLIKNNLCMSFSKETLRGKEQVQGFLLPLIFIILISGVGIFLFNRRFEEVLPVMLMSISLIMFLTGFLDLRVGYVIVFLLPLLIPIWIIYRKKTKQDIYIKEYLLTPAFAIFLLLYSIIYIINFNRGFMVWDEFSHWGPMVKETLRLNQFYSIPESTLYVHKDYPPIITLFETLWCKLCGGYSEKYIYRSLQVLEFSLLFPFLRRLEWKKSVSFIAKLACILVIMMVGMLVIGLGEAKFYSTIYTDAVLAILLAYGLAFIYINEECDRFSIFCLIILLSFILLTKQMGMVFFLIIWGTLILKLLLERNYQKWFVGLITLILPCGFYMGWSYYVSKLKLGQQFSVRKMDIFSIFD